jgi:small-conductance mechanosensitive channel
MKDITSTSFGFLIAYLLPGLVALYAFSLWLDPIQSQLKVFLTADANVGLFLLVILTAIALGLQLTAVRWVVFELLLFKALLKIVIRKFKRWSKKHRLSEQLRLSEEDFSSLGVPGKLEAFRAATDEHYRYHQFWGGMTIVLPILYLALRSSPSYSSWVKSCWSVAVFVVIEIITFAAAIKAYSRYASRGNKIMKGDVTMPNGWGKRKKAAKRRRPAAKKRSAAKKKRPAAKKKRAAKK